MMSRGACGDYFVWRVCGAQRGVKLANHGRQNLRREMFGDVSDQFLAMQCTEAAQSLGDDTHAVVTRPRGGTRAKATHSVVLCVEGF